MDVAANIRRVEMSGWKKFSGVVSAPEDGIECGYEVVTHANLDLDCAKPLEDEGLEEVDDFEKDARNREECPRCRTMRMQQQHMNLYMSVCGHTLCETCLNHVFHNTPSYPCVVCHVLRMRSDYVLKLFEDGSVHKSVVIRKKELKGLNLRLEDFHGNTRKYNDYLEMKEDIVYNLENNIDVNQTRRTLQLFVDRHKDAISANRNRAERELKRQQQLNRERQRAIQQAEEEAIERERRARQLKEKFRQNILEQLASSTDPAATLKEAKRALIQQHKAEMALFLNQENESSNDQPAVSFECNAPSTEEYPLFHYQPTPLHLRGPPVPSSPELQRISSLSRNLLPTEDQNLIDPTLFLRRAVQDAFSCLFEH
eukprot:gene273-3648_t